MSPRRTRASRPVVRLVTGLAAVAALLSAAPAGAATAAHRDPAGDVVAVSGGRAVPGNTSADLVRLGVAHTTTAVRVTASVRSATGNWNLRTDLATPSARYQVLLARISGTPYVVLSRRGKAVRCRGLGQSIDPVSGTLQVSVPRGCLGTPAWVRVGSVMTAKDGDTTVADDARLTGRLRANGAPRLGGRVSAG